MSTCDAHATALLRIQGLHHLKIRLPHGLHAQLGADIAVFAFDPLL
jgi:hypothetical protein